MLHGNLDSCDNQAVKQIEFMKKYCTIKAYDVAMWACDCELTSAIVLSIMLDLHRDHRYKNLVSCSLRDISKLINYSISIPTIRKAQKRLRDLGLIELVSEPSTTSTFKIHYQAIIDMATEHRKNK